MDTPSRTTGAVAVDKSWIPKTSEWLLDFLEDIDRNLWNTKELENRLKNICLCIEGLIEKAGE